MGDIISGFICACLIMGTIVLVLFKGHTYLGSQECARWGGEYHWSTGCLMELDGVRVTLSDYKQIQYASVAKPIPTNQNMNVSMEIK